MSASDPLNILVIHGPNMNLVGKRPAEIFGTLTLDKINRSLRRTAQNVNAQLKIFQSNSEPDIVTKLQRQRTWSDGILINPTTLCFTSYTLLDTLELVALPTVEVHQTATIAGRMASESLLGSYCFDRVIGPPDGAYEQALKVLVKHLRSA